MSTWWTYVLRCADGLFYTGITTDLVRRVAEHNGSVKGAKFTRFRRPVTVHYAEQHPSRSEALKREYVLRHLKREEKAALGGNSNE